MLINITILSTFVMKFLHECPAKSQLLATRTEFRFGDLSRATDRQLASNILIGTLLHI